MITVYHGTDYPHEVLRAGTWVSKARQEAVDYAEACPVSKMIDDPLWQWFYVNRAWLLELHVTPEQVDWKDGYGDPEFDGQHGTLIADSHVIRAIELSIED